MSALSAPDYHPVDAPASEPARSPRAPSRKPPPAVRPARAALDAGVPVDSPPAPVTAPRAPFVVLVLMLVSAGLIGLLVLNTEINENSFRLKGLRDRQVELDTREQQLGSALAEKQSPGNLAAAAKRLGLVPAGTPAFLHLPDGRVLGVPQPGGARHSTGR